MRKENLSVMIILETGEFVVTESEYSPCDVGGYGHNECGNFYSIITHKKKLDIAKIMLVNHAIKEEQDKLDKQQEIITRLRATKKLIYP
jgi:hypothetical protein